MFRPAYDFGKRPHTPDPDYTSPDAWAALPDVHTEAYLSPPNTDYPEAQANAPADTFFVHPSPSPSPRHWNSHVQDPGVVKGVIHSLKYMASVFNAASRVYVPRYRDATIFSFIDRTGQGVMALGLAYRDVERAFDCFITHHNRGRPFILAAHSQGSAHGYRLLRERIARTPLARRLVAAYLPGYAIPLHGALVPSSKCATDTAVLSAWNTYAPRGDPRAFTIGIPVWERGAFRVSSVRRLLQTNPLSWLPGGGRVGRESNPGSLPYYEVRDGLPPLLPGVCGADASGAVVLVEEPEIAGFTLPETDPPMPILNSRNGDYHLFDYMLFYESIRKNALYRVQAYLAKRRLPPP